MEPEDNTAVLPGAEPFSAAGGPHVGDGATGASPSSNGPEAMSWYDDLRNQYRPDRVRLLFVAESPPDPRKGDRRFFYAPDLKVDNLYRAVALALYGKEPGFDEPDKPAVLERMRRDGVWLVDAVDTPVKCAVRSRTQDAHCQVRP